jgi:hypothetical protein
MVKFAKGEEKPFDPISNKLLSAIASPPQDEAPKEETLPPEPQEVAPAEPSPALPQADDSRDQAKRPPAKKTSERGKKRPAKQPTLKVLTRPSGQPERLNCVVKCLFTPSEDQELRAMVARLAQESGTKLTLSHLMRPYFDLLLHCEEQLTDELHRANISRPINDKTALAYFERRLAEVIHNALRKAPLLRSDRPDSDD